MASHWLLRPLFPGRKNFRLELQLQPIGRRTQEGHQDEAGAVSVKYAVDKNPQQLRSLAASLNKNALRTNWPAMQ